MRQVQKGFTLIELMIVVAIVGILAAVAIPAYSDYTTRAKITDGMSLAAGAKAVVAENILNGEADRASGFVAIGGASAATANVQSVGVASGTGVVSVTYVSGLTSAGTQGVLTLSPTGGTGGAPITWDCASANIADNLLPASCR